MKKILIVFSGAVLALTLILLLLILLINSSPFQKSILKRIPDHDIVFEGIKINPFGNIKVRSLHIKGENIEIRDINVDIRYKFFKALKSRIELVNISIDSVMVIPPKDTREKTSSGFDMPEFPRQIFTINKIDVHLNKITIPDLMEVDGVKISGSVVDNDIEIDLGVGNIKEGQAGSRTTIEIAIKGVLFKHLNMQINSKTDIEDHSFFINIPVLLDLERFSANISPVIFYEDSKLVGLNIEMDLKDDTANIKASGSAHLKDHSYDMYKLSEFSFILQDSAISVNINNNEVEISKLNAHSKIKLAMAHDQVNIQDLEIIAEIIGKDNALSLNIENGIKGVFEKEIFTVSGKINASVSDILNEMEIKFNGDQDIMYKKNRIGTYFNGGGTQEDLGIRLDVRGIIDEEIDGNIIRADLSINSSNIVKIPNIFGSFNAGLNIRELIASDLNLRSYGITMRSDYAVENDTLRTNLNVNIKDFLEITSEIKGDIISNIFDIGATKINIDPGRINLRDFNVTDISSIQGSLYADIPSFGFDANQKKPEINLKVNIYANDIAIIGENIAIPQWILKKNTISSIISYSLENDTFELRSALNEEKDNLFATIILNGDKKNMDISGQVTLQSGNSFLILYQDYLYRGKLSIPFNVKYDYKNVIANLNIEMERINLSSQMVKMNNLTGNIPIHWNLKEAENLAIPEPLDDPILRLSPSEKKKYNLNISRLYFEEYYIDNFNANIDINNYLDVRNISFRFLGGTGNGHITFTQKEEFWVKLSFTNGYAFDLLKNAPKDFTKKDTLINLNANIYGKSNDLNGFVKMPNLGRGVLLNMLYVYDPDNENPEIATLKRRIRTLGYYPETIEIDLMGSTASLYVPLRKKGINPLNLPFSIQNIPIKKLATLYN